MILASLLSKSIDFLITCVLYYRQSLSGFKPLPQVTSGKKLSHSKSETTTKGSMFATSQRGQPSHYTIHPDWASET